MRTVVAAALTSISVLVMQPPDPNSIQPRPIGVRHEGQYHHIATGMDIPIPLDWSVVDEGSSSDGGDQIYLRYSRSPQIYVAVWMRHEVHQLADIDDRLLVIVPNKTQQRSGVPGFAFRVPTIRHESIDGHKGVRAIADYREGTADRVEYFTWVCTTRTLVQFDVRGPAAEAESTARAFQPIIERTVIP
jgi:hypothetical protein